MYIYIYIHTYTYIYIYISDCIISYQYMSMCLTSNFEVREFAGVTFDWDLPRSFWSLFQDDGCRASWFWLMMARLFCDDVYLDSYHGFPCIHISIYIIHLSSIVDLWSLIDLSYANILNTRTMKRIYGTHDGHWLFLNVARRKFVSDVFFNTERWGPLGSSVD